MSIKQINGLPIIDAKKPLVITVTEKDIAQADRKDPGCCAMARACRRELKVKEARVHLGRIYLRFNDHNWVRYTTPTRLRTEIIAFDRGGSFESDDFTLGKPPKTTGKRQGSDKAKNGKRKDAGKKRHPYHLVKGVRTGPSQHG